MHWFERWQVVVAVGGWLLEREAMSACELQRYYEEPWKWTDAYQDYIEQNGIEQGV